MTTVKQFAVKHARELLVVTGLLLLLLYLSRTYRFLERFSQQPKLLLVYADWCGHCKTFKPAWDSMGPTVTIAGQTVLLESINETETERLAPYKSQVSGYPTVLLEANGEVVKYTGERSQSGLRAFLQSKLS